MRTPARLVDTVHKDKDMGSFPWLPRSRPTKPSSALFTSWRLGSFILLRPQKPSPEPGTSALSSGTSLPL